MLDNLGSQNVMEGDVHTTYGDDNEWRLVESRWCKRKRLMDLRGRVHVRSRMKAGK